MGLLKVIKNLLPKRLFSDLVGTPRITISNLGFVTINESRYRKVKIRVVNANKIDNSLDNLLDEISELKKQIDQLDKRNQQLQTFNINLHFENSKEIRKNLTLEAELNSKHGTLIKSYENENEELKKTIEYRAKGLRTLTEKNSTIRKENQNLVDKNIELNKQIKLLQRNDRLREEHLQIMRGKYERVVKANIDFRKDKKSSQIN